MKHDLNYLFLFIVIRELLFNFGVSQFQAQLVLISLIFIRKTNFNPTNYPPFL